MKRRLYDISYDAEQYDIRGNKDTGHYDIVNKETFDHYTLGGVIGIEQISCDEFLVYRRGLWCDEFEIVRLKFDTQSHLIYKLYCKKFHKFDFLTKDIIIFDKNNPSSGILYSISNNTEYDSFNHVLGSEPDCYTIKGREVEFLYKNKYIDEYCTMEYPIATDYPIALSIIYSFWSQPIEIGAYLQVVLDVNTLKPISAAYSSLRDKYFYLDDPTTLGKIAREDSIYAKIIGKALSEFYSKSTLKDVNELINYE